MRIFKKLGLCSLALAACLGFILSGSAFAMGHDTDTTDQTATTTDTTTHDGDTNGDHTTDTTDDTKTDDTTHN